MESKLKQLRARFIQLTYNRGEAGAQRYKPVDVPEVRQQKIEASDFSEKGKQELRRILTEAQVSWFKNDCGNLSSRYTHTIRGGVQPAVRQYPLNPEAIEEMDQIVKELLEMGILREELNPITNSPIQAVRKAEAAGGGWRPVINFNGFKQKNNSE